jgi:hypothetical protein
MSSNYGPQLEPTFPLFSALFVFRLTKKNHQTLLCLFVSRMHERFGLILCQIAKARLHDDIRILAVRKSPCCTLVFLSNTASCNGSCILISELARIIAQAAE